MALPKKKKKRSSSTASTSNNNGLRLNKFVRRLHDMLIAEKDSGVVEWRRGLLVLQNTSAFAKQILPKYFNTRNFKTFRRQLNYYGFVHVRSFSSTGADAATTALWVNKDLAETATQHGTNPEDIESVLLLKRVEACETAKTAEGRRVRKKLATSVVEEDLGVSAKVLQKQQILSLGSPSNVPVPLLLKNKEKQQQPHHHQIVLEHYNHNTSTASSLIAMPKSTVPTKIDYIHHATYPQRMVSASSGEDSLPEQVEVAKKEPVASSKPPTSSRSAANLLLLLSKAY